MRALPAVAAMVATTLMDRLSAVHVVVLAKSYSSRRGCVVGAIDSELPLHHMESDAKHMLDLKELTLPGIDTTGTDLAFHVLALAHEHRKMKHELDTIQATLLVNFGPGKHDQYGFSIDPSHSALSSMLYVLEKLVQMLKQSKGETNGSDEEVC